MTRREGYSFVELVLAIILVGLLVRLGVPRFRDQAVRRAAAAIEADVQRIREAALTHFAARKTWPAEVAAGAVPPELEHVLPDDFRFRRADRTYDFEVWPSSGALTGLPQSSGDIVGVTVRTTDPKLLQALARRAIDQRGAFSTPNAMTFIISARSGG